MPNPNLCSKNSECPSKLCKNIPREVPVPYEITYPGINGSLIRATQTCNTTLNITCPQYGVCKNGKCEMPTQAFTTEFKNRCETAAETLTRYATDPGAALADRLGKTFAPLCTEPRLLYVAFIALNNIKTAIWPVFNPENTGPYYTSVNDENGVYLYTKGGTVATIVEFTTNAAGGALSGELSMGEISLQQFTFADVNTNNFIVSSNAFKALTCCGLDASTCSFGISTL